ncbi:hypothetical protein BDZ97DRAFT_1929697 [Flammula alnicola]|nr:hypothetical protein BDZ97DRAFT_1929697 [Flammula alnicola]
MPNPNLPSPLPPASAEWCFKGPGPDSLSDEPASSYNQRRVCRYMTYKISRYQNRNNDMEDDNCSVITSSCTWEHELSSISESFSESDSEPLSPESPPSELLPTTPHDIDEESQQPKHYESQFRMVEAATEMLREIARLEEQLKYLTCKQDAILKELGLGIS